ncbi:MAG: threonine synthase [Syntrophothermus sp.]
MKLYSTNNSQNTINFRDAVIKGIADDGGLYMPAELPELPESFFRNIHGMDLAEIAVEVSNHLLKDEINEQDIEIIVKSAINFPAPLIQLKDGPGIVELFHGPTLAFKDFGARYMSRMLSYFRRNETRDLVILVATSGDTGSAVAHGFYNVEGIRVVLLYPSGKVSNIQEKQLTTLGGNISALEIEGTFDDCQRLVKQAFADKELSQKRELSSANSINIGRLIPQSFYYFGAFAQLDDGEKAFIISVPSGNFGNLTAGLFAWKMGLPVSRFIAATNSNDIFPKFLETGRYDPKPSQQTLSNAMDVGNPSNFARIKALFGGSTEKIKEIISGYAFNDDETKNAIKEVNNLFDYVIDPHGAVGYLALKRFAKNDLNSYNSVILETAHPSKFTETVKSVLEKEIEMPDSLKDCLSKEKNALRLSADYDDLRSYLFTF